MPELTTLITAKLPKMMADELSRAAQSQSVPKSELIREAVADLLARIRATKWPSALELAGDVVGCVKDAPADLSTNPAYLADFGK